MSNSQSPISYEILQTGDGSPTLSLSGGEKMHSMEGALSESLYIYGNGLRRAMQDFTPARVLSMGLGLSYNEWIALALAEKGNSQSLVIDSFESQEFLNQSLKSYLIDESSALTDCYEFIVSSVATEFELEARDLKQKGKAAWEKGDWSLHSNLPKKNQQPYSFSCILYDAFSSETDDDLWSEEHFEKFLDEYCDPQGCLFTTYAATGKLKRSLQKKGFLFEKKAGFGKKRESTLALLQNQK